LCQRILLSGARRVIRGNHDDTDPGGDRSRHPRHHRDLRPRREIRHRELRDRSARRAGDDGALPCTGRWRVSLPHRRNRRRCRAGYAYAGPYRTRVAYRNTLEDSIYLDPQFHGRGIGRALLNRLLAESEARGYRQMIAVIGDSAQAASIALHRAAGFRMVGTFEAVGHKFGRWLDTVLMQRALGEGATTAP
jgi:GNAT superfamily N-acetyltransferase